jgi:quercetin dioxygenase-like cupin family protein
MSQDTASPSAIVRKDLLTALIAGEKDIARVEIKEIVLAPSQQTGLHRHPCPVVGYVAAGTIRFQVEGDPAELLPAGSAFFEPADARIAQFDNASAQEPATFIAFYLLGRNDRQIIEMLR